MLRYIYKPLAYLFFRHLQRHRYATYTGSGNQAACGSATADAGRDGREVDAEELGNA